MRFESKYSIDPIYQGKFLTWLFTSRLCFKKCYNDRQVNSLYYDSLNYKALIDNIDGISNRSKVRLRWYGSSDLPRSASLEIKHKRNSLGFKDVFNLDNIQDFTNHRSLLRALYKIVPIKQKKYLFTYSYPTAIIRYTRSYYLSKCREIRITIDKNIRYSRQRNNKFNLKYQFPLNRNIIVELKYNEEFKDYLTANLRNFPLRISKNSKYVNTFPI